MSAAIDTQHPDTLLTPQQDVGQPRFAPTPSGSRAAWCVAATLPKAERRAHAALHRFGFNAYLPTITIKRRDRSWHTQPLWPGYVFVMLDLAKPWSPVRHCPGVFNLVSFNGSPAICPQGAVEAIQAAEDARHSRLPLDSAWRPGQPCRLNAGPFQGADAVVLKVGQEMATIALMMLGQLREVAVQLNCLSVRDA